MFRILKRVWPWLAAVATGLLGVACFAPFDQSWICWIALTPLIAAVWFSGENCKRRWLRNLLLGYLAGIVFFTGTFSWLGALGDLYQSLFLHGLSFLLSLYLGLHFAFWAWFIGLIRPTAVTASWRNLLIAFVAAAAWATHEWIRGWLFSGFGWNGLGVGLHQSWPLIQISEFTGVVGLSFALAFVNIIAITTPLRLFAEARTNRMRPHFDLTLTMIAMVALFAFGIRRAKNPEPTEPLRVAAVQASVPQFQKFDPEFTREIFERFTRLSEIALRANPPPDLLIWPESSMPDLVRDPSTASHQFVRQLLGSTKSDLLLGSLDLEDGRDYNAALLVSSGRDRIQAYRKIHLVPFGEYVPLRHSFPLFAAIANTWVPGDFTPGTDYIVFDLTNNGVRVAPLICFEDTVGDLARRFVLNGATLLVDVTNDGWFLESSGSRQHLANAIFRCVENRRPMVRAANTGVTCFINQFGHVTQMLRDDTGNTFTEGVLSGEINVPRTTGLTFYTRHGEWFAEICAVITAIAVGVIFARRRFGRGRSPERPAGD
ncbi:MAG TPA: apolipoprotein N-acyltransferase [Chthoniobacterales bacterium]|nr:apolipoprotein N-acyltransferase [Chthoniobacterales bacterium]